MGQPTATPESSTQDGAPDRPQLYADGMLVASGDFPHTTPVFFEIEGLSVGIDEGSPVIDGHYTSPFAFTGTIHSVTIDVSGDPITDEAEQRALLARQELDAAEAS